MNALGFHYFPDTLHYRQADLETWLPRLTALGAKWLVLQAEAGQAVPELFVRGLIEHGITPILQVQARLAAPPNPFEQRPLLEAYARWGVRYIQYFDLPNQRSAWPAHGWVQQNLVERFLDIWMPFATLTANVGLLPVLPALCPGGDYWDTAFLDSALKSLQRRKAGLVLEKLVLSAYAWSDGRSLDWGLGGQKAWPETHAYHRSESSQDQCGFRISDWYLQTAGEILQRQPEILLYQAGLPTCPKELLAAQVDADIYHPDLLAVARLACGEDVWLPGASNALAPLAEAVKACCLWLLATGEESAFQAQTWFNGADRPTLLAEAWMKHCANSSASSENSSEPHPVIEHYLLLPTFEWGVADWHLEIIRPLIKKYRPTIGFSMKEAALARRVTVIGNDAAFSAEHLQALRSNGCIVEQIDETGMDFATLGLER